MDGGIAIIEMLNKSNIVALVGGGKYPKYPRNKVILWDDYQAKVISELSFNSYIKNVKMKKDKIIIVCDTKIYLFNLLNFQNIDTLDTFENISGIIAITYDPKINIIAYPDKASGYVRLKNYDKNDTILMNAHENKITCLAISNDGRFLASTSDKGKFVRIFKTDDGVFLHELKRGNDSVEIFSLSFDQSNKFVSCSCSTGDIHIFSLDKAHKAYNEFVKQK
jgi:WD40 repeat protein